MFRKNFRTFLLSRLKCVEPVWSLLKHAMPKTLTGGKLYETELGSSKSTSNQGHKHKIYQKSVNIKICQYLIDIAMYLRISTRSSFTANKPNTKKTSELNDLHSTLII